MTTRRGNQFKRTIREKENRSPETSDLQTGNPVIRLMTQKRTGNKSDGTSEHRQYFKYNDCVGYVAIIQVSR